MLLQEGFDVLAVTYAALSNFHCAEDTSEEKEGCHIELSGSLLYIIVNTVIIQIPSRVSQL